MGKVYECVITGGEIYGGIVFGAIVYTTPSENQLMELM